MRRDVQKHMLSPSRNRKQDITEGIFKEARKEKNELIKNKAKTN